MSRCMTKRRAGRLETGVRAAFLALGKAELLVVQLYLLQSLCITFLSVGLCVSPCLCLCLCGYVLHIYWPGQGGVPTPMQVAAHMQMQQQMAALQQQATAGGSQAAMKAQQQLMAQSWQQQQMQQLQQYQQQQVWQAQQQQIQQMQQWAKR